MTLSLLPNLLCHTADTEAVLPPIVSSLVPTLDGLIAESEKEGRRFLSRFRKDARLVPIALFREKPSFLLEPLLDGESWGVVSDAGLPCIADPGSELVRLAHKRGIRVNAYPGPSAIILTLMLSGLYSQQFAFHGYIAKEPKKREDELLLWEKSGSVQLFIEAPHRNQYTFETCLKLLKPKTRLTIACNLTAPDQWIETREISAWEERVLPKQPVTFALLGRS